MTASPSQTPVRQSQYSYDELIACGEGRLFGPGNAQLPLPNMLMFDRISSITIDGGAHDKGRIVAELDVNRNLWFFQCHFRGDPVMPGCLGLDALWQMVGFWLGWSGSPGKGRALGVGEVKFTGQVTDDVKRVRYEVDIRKVVRRGFAMALADGVLFADDRPIYETKDLKVGLFKPEDLVRKV